MQLVASQLRTKGEKDRVFRKYILPTVRNLCVSEITKTHALTIVDTLVAQGKRPMADKVRQEGAAFFEWLIEREHVERNVFARIRKTKNSKTIRTRVLTDDEVRAIWEASEVEGRWWRCGAPAGQNLILRLGCGRSQQSGTKTATHTRYI